MRYHNITKDDMKNGSGLRTVLWVAGCGHRCPGCHNPITWDAQGGLPFDRAAGEELMEAAGRDYMSGITFSGGDPLYPSNREEIGRLCQALKGRFPDKTIWLYTGYLWEKPAVQQLPWLPLVDVLVDGPFVEALKDNRLHWCGSSNQRIIDVPKSLAAGSAVLWKG